MKHQLITLKYRGKEKDILLYSRGEDYKKYEISARGFEPYMFVPENSPIEPSPFHLKTELGYKTIYGESVVKLTVTDPMAVEKWRPSFSTHFEADIRFVRRFLID